MSIAEEESTRKYYLLEGPEHGEGLREKLLDAALENRHVIAQREAYVAGRTAEPTEAEIEAAARVLWIDEHRNSFPSMNDVEMACKESFTLDIVSTEYEDRAEHMLTAARKAVTA